MFNAVAIYVDDGSIKPYLERVPLSLVRFPILYKELPLLGTYTILRYLMKTNYWAKKKT